MDKINRLWKNPLIKKKLIISVAASLMGSIIAIVIAFILFYSYLNNFSHILEDYSDNQSLNSAFNALNNTFQDYASDRESSEKKEAYLSACSEMNLQLKRLPADYAVIGRERYLKTMSIVHGYEGYMRECQHLFMMDPSEEEYIDQLYKCYKIADYIQIYIDRLIDISLKDGVSLYQKNLHNIQAFPVVCLAFVCLHILCLYLFAKSTRSLEKAYQQSVYAKELHEKELLQLHTEQDLKKIQFRLLQNQINPHFLFNTLNLISGIARIEEAENTAEMIQRLSNIFRYNLKSQAETTSLFAEITIARDYYYIQKRRFGQRIHLDWDIQVDPLEIFIPSFTIQPLLENSVIHGISPKEKGGRIRIRIFQRNGMNHLSVVDNGIGISPDKLKLLRNSTKTEPISGIGLSNVHSRFQSLCPESTFTIRSKYMAGTAIVITWKNTP